MPDACTVLPHEADHIRPLKHHGPTTLANLCWACALCNSCKSSNLAGYDPATQKLSRLFNPRTDGWADHFRWDGPMLEGMTGIGRRRLTCCALMTRRASSTGDCFFERASYFSDVLKRGRTLRSEPK